jgi:hypothetical protein
MASRLGTPLSRKSIAWFWFSGAVFAAAALGWRALASGGSLIPAGISAVVAVLIAVEPRLRRAQVETVQIDDTGVLRVDGSIREHILWSDIDQIRIITTDDGPYGEDVYFALSDSQGKGCLVPHDAAVRTQLLEELQSRFPGLDNDAVIRAMGSTSNNSFLVWERRRGAAA